MKFKVIGHVFQNGEKWIVCYGEFSDHTEAHDHKEYLEDSNNWKGKMQDKPYIIYIEEVKTEGDKYFDEAMRNEEQDEY